MDLWISSSGDKSGRYYIVRNTKSLKPDIRGDSDFLEFSDEPTDIEWWSDHRCLEYLCEHYLTIGTRCLNLLIYRDDIFIGRLYISIEDKSVYRESDDEYRDNTSKSESEKPGESTLYVCLCMGMLNLHKVKLWILSWA